MLYKIVTVLFDMKNTPHVCALGEAESPRKQPRKHHFLYLNWFSQRWIQRAGRAHRSFLLCQHSLDPIQAHLQHLELGSVREPDLKRRVSIETGSMS